MARVGDGMGRQCEAGVLKLCAFIARTAAGLVAASFLLLGGISPARAEYDIETRGIPKFVRLSYIDLTKITRISKFRSSVGHNYSDLTQFGKDAVKDSRGVIENCRSMKHYFLVPDSSVKIFAPVTGTVTLIMEGNLGVTVEIQSEAQPDFSFGMFHVKTTTPLRIGDRVMEGQLLGTHIGLDTWSDFSVWVQTPRGKHLISYFETLTDEGFAPFKARGVASRESLVRTRAERDAANTCSFTAPQSDFVELAGTAPATQSVAVQTKLPDTVNVGDVATPVAATASSGLPVLLVSSTPKVCTVSGNAMTPRHPGVCKLLATQPGNDTTIEATPVALRTLVLAKGATLAPPRLGTVFPPTGAGPQSYLRFYNTGTTAGTVTASLLDAVSGRTLATWKSPSIAPGAAPQFAINALESASAAGFTRPNSYSVRVEPETTITGYMQHVIFDAQREALMNASTCSMGTTISPYRLMNVHSSHLAAAYPSTVILYNTGISTAVMGLAMRNALDGDLIGRFYSSNITPTSTSPTITYPNGQIILNVSTMETAVITPTNPTVRTNISPPPTVHFNFADEQMLINSQAINSNVFRHYYQHIITNKTPGVVSDMTAMCDLGGRTTATANADLRVGGVYSSLQEPQKSVLRFYNAGTTAGTVSVKIYGRLDDQPLGSWTSPIIAAGAMGEYPISTIETQLTLHRKDSYIPSSLAKEPYYGLSIKTDLEGYFQHVLRKDATSTTSNVSTCADAVTIDGRSLMAVYPSDSGASNHISTIVLTNTGSSSAAAKLNFYDSRDGTLRGSYQTTAIAANGQSRVDVSTVEATGITLSTSTTAGGTNTGDSSVDPFGSGFTFDFLGGSFSSNFGIPINLVGAGTTTGSSTDSTARYYIVKLDDGFTGFLQHMVYNKASGIVTDMTAACMM